MRTLGVVAVGGFLASKEQRGNVNVITISVKERTKNGDKEYKVELVDFNNLAENINAGDYVTAYAVLYPTNYNDRTFLNLAVKHIDYKSTRPEPIKADPIQGDLDEEIPF